MKVKIKGYIEIRGIDNNFHARINNYINIYLLARILYQVYNNTFQSGNLSPSIFIILNNGNITVGVTYNNFEWTGTFEITNYSYIIQLQLFATFNGTPYNISSVSPNLPIPPGKYTINWIWEVNDPAGFVKNTLNYLFLNEYKGWSVIKGTCTKYAGDSVLYDIVTLYFACIVAKATTLYDVTFTFEVEYGKSTTYAVTSTINTTFAYTTYFGPGNTILIPLSITLE